MNLQEAMVELSSYSVGCRIMDGYFLINITYDKQWSVIPPQNNQIEFAQKDNITYYAAPIQEVSFDEVFDSIKETIDYNIDLQKKVSLFKVKVDELQEIFAKEDIEVLRNLTFNFPKKKKEKRKYNRKNKDKEENNERNSEVVDNKTDKTDNLSNTEDATDTVKKSVTDDKEIIFEEYQGDEEIVPLNNKIDYVEELKK